MAEANNYKGWRVKSKNDKAHYFDGQDAVVSICGRYLSWSMKPGKGQVGLCKLCMKKTQRTGEKQMISKEQWVQIEKELKGIFAHKKFKIGNNIISICRERSSESKTVLAVYIDGYIKGKWTPENMPIISDVYRKKTLLLYKPKRKKEILKIWGKKAAKRAFPNLDKTSSFFLPYFSKASVLVRQFKKIKDIELFEEDNTKNVT